MNKFGLGLVALTALLFSSKISAQTVTSNKIGHAGQASDINFTEIANYEKTHPPVLNRKFPFDEGDEGEFVPSHPVADPSTVRMFMGEVGGSNGNTTNTGGHGGTPHTAYLPVSPAPNDSFLAKTTDGMSIPPDTHGSVNETYAVTAINTSVTIELRSTHAVVSTVSLDGFWTSIESFGGGAYDPRVHYDPHYKRWIMMADAYGETNHSQIFIAVSATSDPTGTWHRYKIDLSATSGTWMDFPCVGFNNRWIAISGNFFSSAAAGGSFLNDEVFVLDYITMMSGGTLSYGSLLPTGGSFTICPALTYDTLESNMFCVENWNGGAGQLRLYKITGNIGALTLSTVATPSTTTHWRSSPNCPSCTTSDFAPQLGTTNRLQANDDRTNNFSQRNNKLWCAHTAFLPASGTTTRASAMWWQLDTTGTPKQVGLIDDATGTDYYFFPSIASNKNDDALIGFAHSSTAIHPSCAYAIHLNSDGLSTFRTPFTYRHGLNTYFQTFGGDQNRWGDYSSTCIDPTNTLDFWTIQESVPATPANAWNTWWAYVRVCGYLPAPTAGTGAASPCQGTVSTYSVTPVTGATGYTWTITPSGSGWSGTSTTNSIDVTIGSGTATITVGANDTCGAGPLYTFTVTALPQATEVITSLDTVCAGAATATFTTTATGSPTSYSWTVLGSGWSGSSSTSSLTATVGSGAGMIIVTGSNGCGTGPADTLTVTPGTPPGPATNIVVPTSLCSGTTGVFTTPAVAGATSYIWSVSGVGWSGTSATSTLTATIGTGTGTITVTPVNACGDGTPFTINSIIPTAAPTASFTESLHIATTHTVIIFSYTGSAPGGTTYAWTFGGGTPASSTSAGPVSVYWLTPGTYTISLTVEAGGCSATFTDTVHINHGVGVKEITTSPLTAGIVPNPNDGSFDVVFDQAINTPVVVKLYDMVGREVYKNEFSGTSNNKISIAAGELANGTYAATITANGKEVTQKITITK